MLVSGTNNGSLFGRRGRSWREVLVAATWVSGCEGYPKDSITTDLSAKKAMLAELRSGFGKGLRFGVRDSKLRNGQGFKVQSGYIAVLGVQAVQGSGSLADGVPGLGL